MRGIILRTQHLLRRCRIKFEILAHFSGEATTIRWVRSTRCLMEGTNVLTGVDGDDDFAQAIGMLASTMHLRTLSYSSMTSLSYHPQVMIDSISSVNIIKMLILSITNGASCSLNNCGRGSSHVWLLRIAANARSFACVIATCANTTDHLKTIGVVA